MICVALLAARLARPRALLTALVTVALLVPAAAQARVPGAVPEPAGDDAPAAFERAFRQWARQHRLSGATLAVTHRDRLVLAAGHGGRAADAAVPLASLSKAVTAACVATLIDAGRIRLDSTLAELLPEILARVGRGGDPRLGGITVAQLLTHRAGLGRDGHADPGVTALWALARTTELARIPLAAIVERALREPLGSAPGARFRYSNAGYFALGALVERVSKLPYATACAERVLVPLGIQQARLDPTWGALASTGGWRLSGPAYLAFVRALEPHRPGPVGPVMRQWMLEPAGKAVGAGSTFYSLGLFVRPEASGWTWWHTGSWVTRGRRDARGPREASFATLVTRTADGPTWFVSCEPDPGPPAREALESAFRRAAGQSWPDRDGFPALGLR